jgi:hypothetical protein
LTVIIPAGRPSEPIVLRDVYTKGTLLENLADAVADGSSVETQARRVTPEPQ